MRTLAKTLIVLSSLIAACGGVEDDSRPDKDDFRDLPADSVTDWCEEHGWYGDGTCDEFCALPDPDCAPASTNDCGGLLGLTCDEGEYCDYGDDATCGAADLLGTCTPIPEVCPEIFAPICGCDGNTYSNECFAASVGVPVLHEGECEPPEGSQCGGLFGLACGEGEYCAYPATSCGSGDQLGTCAPRPDVCIEVLDPVCGCDGNTYDNACKAASAGISVLYAGECDRAARAVR